MIANLAVPIVARIKCVNMSRLNSISTCLPSLAATWLALLAPTSTTPPSVVRLPLLLLWSWPSMLAGHNEAAGFVSTYRAGEVLAPRAVGKQYCPRFCRPSGLNNELNNDNDERRKPEKKAYHHVGVVRFEDAQKVVQWSRSCHARDRPQLQRVNAHLRGGIHN